MTRLAVKTLSNLDINYKFWVSLGLAKFCKKNIGILSYIFTIFIFSIVSSHYKTLNLFLEQSKVDYAIPKDVKK